MELEKQCKALGIKHTKRSSLPTISSGLMRKCCLSYFHDVLGSMKSKILLQICNPHWAPLKYVPLNLDFLETNH